MDYFYTPIAPIEGPAQGSNFATSMVMDTDFTIGRAANEVLPSVGAWGRPQQLNLDKTMKKDLVELAKECPGLQVSITLGELVEAGRMLVAETKRELEQEVADSRAESYVSRAQAMQILGKGSSTLWRWKKLGYLVPVTVGAVDRYRMSDIRRIMEGDNTQKRDAV